MFQVTTMFRKIKYIHTYIVGIVCLVIIVTIAVVVIVRCRRKNESPSEEESKKDEEESSKPEEGTDDDGMSSTRATGDRDEPRAIRFLPKQVELKASFKSKSTNWMPSCSRRNTILFFDRQA